MTERNNVLIRNFRFYHGISIKLKHCTNITFDDPSIATVSVSGQELTVTGIAAGETMIHVYIPYGVEHVYGVTVT